MAKKMFSLPITLMLTLCAGSRGDAASGVDEIVSQHTATVEAMQSLTCSVRLRHSYLDRKQEKTYTGEYCRFGEHRKCTTSTEETTEVYVSDGALARRLFTKTTSGGKKAYSGSIAAVERYAVSACDPFNCGYLTFHLPNTIEYVPLSALVAKADSAGMRADEVVGGAPCAKLVLAYKCDPKLCSGRWTIDIWLSRTDGLLVKKCLYSVTLSNGKRQSTEVEIAEFVRTPAGGPFPKSVGSFIQIDGVTTWTSETIIEKIATPFAMPSGAFGLKYYAKTPLTDHLRHTVYTVDETGKRISEEKALGVANIVSGSGTDLESQTDTQVEPKRKLHWIVLGAFTILLGGTLLYKRIRSRRSNEDTHA